MWPIQLAFLLFIFVVYSSLHWLCAKPFHFPHDRSNLSPPSFSDTTFQNFLDTSDLLFLVSKFQHHTECFPKKDKCEMLPLETKQSVGKLLSHVSVDSLSFCTVMSHFVITLFTESWSSPLHTPGRNTVVCYLVLWVQFLLLISAVQRARFVLVAAELRHILLFIHCSFKDPCSYKWTCFVSGWRWVTFQWPNNRQWKSDLQHVPLEHCKMLPVVRRKARFTCWTNVIASRLPRSTDIFQSRTPCKTSCGVYPVSCI